MPTIARALRRRIREVKGYHVLHWSGHGHHNVLELHKDDGKPDHLTGYTGTALELLRGGVPQVVAMRYEVGDPYARDLARRFYQALLAEEVPAALAEALALSRSALAREKAPEHDAVDHATPLLFGGDADAIEIPRGRSSQLRTWRPRPQPLLPSSRELDRPATFVGRGHVLTRLGGTWLGDDGPAVALMPGMPGLGKTALAAETVHLCHGRFDGVLAFQSKSTTLTFDEFLRQLDQRLALHSRPYHELCEDDPNAAVYLKPSARLTGPDRFQRLRDNLVEVLYRERLLVVLDEPGQDAFGVKRWLSGTVLRISPIVPSLTATFPIISNGWGRWRNRLGICWLVLLMT